MVYMVLLSHSRSTQKMYSDTNIKFVVLQYGSYIYIHREEEYPHVVDKSHLNYFLVGQVGRAKYNRNQRFTMLRSKFQMSNALFKGCSIIKMFSKKVEKRILYEIYDAGISLTETSLRYLEKRIRVKKKTYYVANDYMNSLSNASTSSCKHAAQAHVSPNKNLELSIYWYSIEACNLFHPKKEFHSNVYDCLVQQIK